MKLIPTGLCSLVSVLVLVSSALAATPPELVLVPQTVDAHSRLWTFHEKDDSGRLKPTPSATRAPILEIQTGRSFWNGSTWQPSDPKFRVTETAFIADRVHAAATLNAQINVAGAVQISINGVTIRSTPLAVAVYNPKDGSLTILASLTNSTGI